LTLDSDSDPCFFGGSCAYDPITVRGEAEASGAQFTAFAGGCATGGTSNLQRLLGKRADFHGFTLNSS